MEAQEVYASLEKLFPGKVRDFKSEVREPYLFVEPAAIVEVCRFLCNAPGFRFEVLSDLTALDWPKVLDVAKRNATRMGVGDRYSTLPETPTGAALVEGARRRGGGVSRGSLQWSAGRPAA